mmetsp:Transcript_38196/g.107928  ORF Transcript_38196/g.107928 Transcript_38196/m.107928 type:complete len:207 (+) Transcript_38196:914-1534(+)
MALRQLECQHRGHVCGAVIRKRLCKMRHRLVWAGLLKVHIRLAQQCMCSLLDGGKVGGLGREHPYMVEPSATMDNSLLPQPLAGICSAQVDMRSGKSSGVHYALLKLTVQPCQGNELLTCTDLLIQLPLLSKLSSEELLLFHPFQRCVLQCSLVLISLICNDHGHAVVAVLFWRLQQRHDFRRDLCSLLPLLAATAWCPPFGGIHQ